MPSVAVWYSGAFVVSGMSMASVLVLEGYKQTTKLHPVYTRYPLSSIREVVTSLRSNQVLGRDQSDIGKVSGV